MSAWLPVLVAVLAVAPVAAQSCSNDAEYINRQCDHWEKRGDCKLLAVQEGCMKSCGVCEGEDCHNDVDLVCRNAADKGHCSSSPVVWQHCGKACGSCGGSPAFTPRPGPHRVRVRPTRPASRERPERPRRRERPTRPSRPERPERPRNNRARVPANRRGSAPTEFPREENSPSELKSQLAYELRSCFSDFARPGKLCPKLEILFTCAFSVIQGPKAVDGITERMRKDFRDDFKSAFNQFDMRTCDFNYRQLKRKFELSMKTLSADNCHEAPVDLMFLVDTSASINTQSALAYIRALDFAATLLDQFAFLHGNTRVAAIQFANGIFPTHAIEFDEYRTKAQIQQAIRNLIYLPGLEDNWEAGSYSHIWKGLDYMREEFLPMARPTATKVSVILTDGLSNPADGKAARAALKAREAGVTLVAVGIGGAAKKQQFQRELEDITGSAGHVFRVSGASAQARIGRKVKETLCNQPTELREKLPYGDPVFD